MTSFIAFGKKELMEHTRGGRALLLLMLALLFGVMNPAIARLTPWLMELMSDSMEATGLSVTAVKVDAIASWAQFYKNTSMLLVIFMLIFGDVLTKEYQSGTLINMLTKGLSRGKVIAAKASVLSCIWTVLYWVTFTVTYAYNMFFWPDTALSNPLLAALGWYVIGLWAISLLMLASVPAGSGTGALGITAGCFGLLYLLSTVPDLTDYLPVRLMSGMQVLTSEAEPSDFMPAMSICLGLTVLQSIAAVLWFNKKAL